MPDRSPLHLPTAAQLELRGRRFDAARPAVMGIINRTPDSFYAAARYDFGDGLAAAGQMLADGADLIDVGGVRAGQDGGEVSVAEEVERVRPFLLALRERYPEVIISLDTWRAPVALACAEAGVDVINDTWAGADPELVSVAAEIGAGYVVTHTGGLPPRTDPVAITYGDDPDAVVRDVLATLDAGAARAVAAGVPAGRVIVDPTLDFGKTTRHSLRVLRATAAVVELGYPVLQALSRKDFVGETLDRPVDERLYGTLAATAVAGWLGTTVYRAHDVAATRQVIDMVASIRGDRPPTLAVRGEPG
ncbi:dihydropteroate synthase [Propionicimonas sp.]|uniref:dihydropteroate synthase n=1 Tax=Propionicimonas sp. TaxID=1955623 RepID=UPI0017A78140|nr:dihydropteroate synthase [Propionicimonas sp.]MBU3975784.1 dihydropteroate synthase [Actinomycetota bacterium]MBA3022226.1 dihydropteroate synthase [Propionicimonas sp.]MBU3987674.1 dihydropteroate synthase [Actinomycetota bacterium]MBU4006447.1 dihydropteroate synthase [Actinomycetota bacterium]MBU4065326.1 dihydropteroate synthase [Actinomycetota bacterium]